MSLIDFASDGTLEFESLILLWSIADGNQPTVVGGQFALTLYGKPFAKPLVCLTYLEDRKWVTHDGATIRPTAEGQRRLKAWKRKHWGSSNRHLVNARFPTSTTSGGGSASISRRRLFASALTTTAASGCSATR